ncbi:MAG TPA: DegT/DnrJ/EryC1/StrS aminotransferase family protein [Nitrospinaceae bacterium]|nr:DegT/DnrJ/EryC1/StrS aminotransferase family protein [Nitrospinaceae bacterium]
MSLNWPLMENNITREDLDTLVEFLQGNPILTQSENVSEFEREWSEWVGVKYSIFVNSGSSANLISLAALKQVTGSGGEIIVPPLTWVSDISSVLFCGYNPVFVDINPKTLSMNDEQVIAKLTGNTKAVFLTHAQGFNGLTDRLLSTLTKRNIPLIEDVCESHGAEFNNKKVGSFGWVSNFSFYYAHHMTTIEGGMVCTDSEEVYQICRMLRSHGMVREVTNDETKNSYKNDNPELNPEFIFAFPAFNMRNTELGAVLGRNQLKRLDANNEKRRKNFKLFLELLDPEKYQTKFNLDGSCNYAFNLILKKPDLEFCNRVMAELKAHGVEFRRGSAGGGNQLRQPYLRDMVNENEFKKYPVVEHVHFFGFYIGNYPDLPEEKIRTLCDILNKII